MPEAVADRAREPSGNPSSSATPPGWARPSAVTVSASVPHSSRPASLSCPEESSPSGFFMTQMMALLSAVSGALSPSSSPLSVAAMPSMSSAPVSLRPRALRVSAPARSSKSARLTAAACR